MVEQHDSLTPAGAKIKADQNHRKGSLSLEAALFIPIILLVMGCLISAILCCAAEIKVKGALDRVAAEISLLSPACDILQEMRNGIGEIIKSSEKALPQPVDPVTDMLGEIWPEQNLEIMLADATLDLTSSALFGQLIQHRLNFWLNKSCSGQAGWAGRLGSRKIYLEWQSGQSQLWLCLAYKLRTPIGLINRQANVVVPLWIGADDASAAIADQIWQMDNFSRGRLLRQKFGGNLPADFPVIARFAGGEAVAIKSMDLTAPSYQQADEVTTRINRQIIRLTDFSGADYVRPDRTIHLTSSDIASRRLILVIPENCSQNWLSNVIAEMHRLAGSRSVNLEIVRYGVSTRFQTENDDKQD